MSSTYDPSRDQSNSLGGPSSDMGALGSMNGDYGAGGLAGTPPPAPGGAQSLGGVPDRAIPLTQPSTPAITQPTTPAATSTAALPQWKPPATAAPTSSATPGNDLWADTSGGNGGGGSGDSYLPSPGSGGGTAMGGGGLTGGGGGGGGGHVAAGAPIAFAEGGAVPDTAEDPDQDDGVAGGDPITAAISKAMETVDSAFQYGRQKNGLTSGGQNQGSQQDDGDSDDDNSGGGGGDGAMPDGATDGQ